MLMPLARVKFQIRDLVNEILDQLPPDTWTDPAKTFLDPAIGGGQFLVEIQRRLREAGHSDENIAERMWGCEIRNIRLLYAKNWHKVISNHLIKTDFVSYDWGDMKFDVIVGNPPYQDNDGNPLYYKFHNICVKNLLKDGGYISLVTPDAMAAGLETGTIKGRHNVAQVELQVINMSSAIKTKYFPNIGINNFCWYVARTGNNVKGSYTIVTNSGSYVGKLNPLKPVVSTTEVLSLLDKCFKHNLNIYNGSWSTAGTLAEKNPRGKSQVVTNINDKGELVKYRVRWKSRHKMDGSPKVFITGFGNRAAVAYDHSLVAAVEKTVYTVLTASDRESENLVSLLDCNLQKWFSHVIKARGPYIDFLKHFRGVPLNKKWSDAALYKHFGLTQDEIKLVESI